MNVKIACVGEEELLSYPDVIATYLGNMLHEDFADFYAKALSRYYQIWIVYEQNIVAMFVTLVSLEQGNKIIEVVHFVGRVTKQNLIAVDSAISAFKFCVGAIRIEFNTKHSVKRLPRFFGYEQFGNVWWRA